MTLGQLPPAAIPGLRAALAAEGYSPLIVTDAGGIDVATLLSQFYDTAEFRSNFTPPIAIRVSSTLGPGTSPFAQIAQPALILTGRLGETSIAPFGVPSPLVGFLGALAIFAGVFGLGFLFGRSARR